MGAAPARAHVASGRPAPAPWLTAGALAAHPSLWSEDRAPAGPEVAGASAGAAAAPALVSPVLRPMWSRRGSLLSQRLLLALPPRPPSLDGAGTRVGTVCAPWGFPAA